MAALSLRKFYALFAILLFSLALSENAQTQAFDDNSSAVKVLNPRGLLPMSDEEKLHISELLRISGATSFAKILPSMLTTHIVSILRTSNPAIPASSFAIISEEANKAFSESIDAPGGLMELYSELYHKYFSDDEIKQMLAFYASPIGQKSVAVLPLLAKESLAIGQRMGEKLAPVVVRRIQERIASQGASATYEVAINTSSSHLLDSPLAERTARQQPPAMHPAGQAFRVADADFVRFANTVRAKVRSNIIFDVPPNLEGNPSAEVETELFPNGSIRAVRITKSSGIAAYDHAVMRAVQVSSPFPMPSNGKMPAKVIFHMFLRDG
jgi:TonB family protein